MHSVIPLSAWLKREAGPSCPYARPAPETAVARRVLNSSTNHVILDRMSDTILDKTSIDAILTMLGGLIAGLAGIVVAWFTIWKQRRHSQTDLIKGLLSELSVAAELLDVDLERRNLPQSATAGCEIVRRLRSARQIFDSAADAIGGLPEPLPEALVRYYGRLETSAGKLEEILDGLELYRQGERYETIRKALLTEVESLRHALREALKK